MARLDQARVEFDFLIRRIRTASAPAANQRFIVLTCKAITAIRTHNRPSRAHVHMFALQSAGGACDARIGSAPGSANN